MFGWSRPSGLHLDFDKPWALAPEVLVPGPRTSAAKVDSSCSTIAGLKPCSTQKSLFFFRRRDYFFRRVFHCLCDDKVQTGLLQDFSSLLDVRAFEPQNHRKLNLCFIRGFDHASRQRIHTQDAAKN